MVVRVGIQRPVRHHDIGLHLVEPIGDDPRGLSIGHELLVGEGEELRRRAQDLASGGRLCTRTSGFRPVEESPVAPESGAVSQDDLVSLPRQRGDQPAGPRLGVVRDGLRRSRPSVFRSADFALRRQSPAAQNRS